MTTYHWTPPGNYFADYLIADEDNMVIAFVPPNTGGEPAAKLFAAAPQLLEACKAMEEWADKDINLFSPRFVKAMDLIATAIAAAEGEP